MRRSVKSGMREESMRDRAGQREIAMPRRGHTLLVVAGIVLLTVGATQVAGAQGEAKSGSSPQDDGTMSNLNAAVAGEPAQGEEASNEPKESANVKQNVVSVSRTAAPAGFSEDEGRELADYNRVLERYDEASGDYSKDVRRVIERRYQERLAGIQTSYEKSIRDLETEEKIRREDAIAQFETFLQRHPKDPRYSPGAIIRLAELHFEKSESEYLEQEREYQRMLEMYDKGELKIEPTAPRQDFSRMLTLYKQLLRDFPWYERNDVALYMLGYCQRQMDYRAEALKSFLTLTQTYPRSKLIPEAWTLLGEIYFEEDDYSKVDDSLRKAISAYGEVLKYPDHPYYDKALYKQAWSYYRLDDYNNAVQRFLQVVDIDEKRKQATGQSGSDLRPEAVRYLAISFSDTTWDKGGFDNLRILFEKAKQENPRAASYEREVFKALGDAYFEQTMYERAVVTYKYGIELDPLAKENPALQSKVIEARLLLREEQAAAEERETLVATYSADGEWHKANENDPETIIEAQRLMEEALQQAGAYYHISAQSYMARAEKAKGEGDEASYAADYRKGREYFALAARNHEEYLRRFPFSKMAYEVRYLYADSLFWQDKYDLAAKEFEAVRDSTAGDKYMIEAGAQAVVANQYAINGAIKEGKLEDRPLKSFEGKETDPKVSPQELPPLVSRAVASSDAYIEKVQPYTYSLIGVEPEKKQEMIRVSDKNAALAAYLAGEQFYLYDQYEAARKRLFVILTRYAKSEYALDAANMIIQTYVAERNWDKVRETTELAARLLAEGTSRFLGVRDNAIFFKALGLLEAGKYEQAAIEFLEVVEKNPDYKDADVAYYNAALCYVKTFRYNEAYNMYRILYEKYPKSKLADEALFRVAVNAEASYKYDESIARYRQLIKTYSDSKFRWQAQYNMAMQLEYQQRYEDSAQEYLLFNKTYADNDLAPGAIFFAATVYEKQYQAMLEKGSSRLAGQARQQAIDTYRRYIERYRTAPKESDQVIQAYYRISRLAEDAGNEREKKLACERAMAEWQSRGLQRQQAPKAAKGAAHCAFEVAEIKYDEFKKLPLGTSAKPEILRKELEKKATAMTDTKNHYKKVFAYGDPEWILAAYFMIGFADQAFAEALVNSPCPPEVKRMGQIACDEYKSVLVEKAAPIEDRAVTAYEEAYAKTRELGVVNEWVERIEETLSQFRPDQYPLLKEPIQHLETHVVSGATFVVPRKPEEDVDVVEPDLLTAPPPAQQQQQQAPAPEQAPEQAPPVDAAPTEAAPAEAPPAEAPPAEAPPAEAPPADSAPAADEAGVQEEATLQEDAAPTEAAAEGEATEVLE